MPTGGINFENAEEWIHVGVKCLDVRSILVNELDLETGDYDQIKKNAARMVGIVEDAPTC